MTDLAMESVSCNRSSFEGAADDVVVLTEVTAIARSVLIAEVARSKFSRHSTGM
jgi:hypothetical protein